MSSRKDAMNTEETPMYGWNELPWEKIERRTFKLQKRIYQASQRGDVKTVHTLQKLLVKSWSAKCLAVRRVTQDNQALLAKMGTNCNQKIQPRMENLMGWGKALMPKGVQWK